MAYNSWKSQIKNLIILEYYTQSLKKKRFRIQKCKCLKGYVNVCTQYLVLESFLNKILYQWDEGWSRSACDTAVVLWKPRIALITALSSSVWLGLVSLIFLLSIQHRFCLGLRWGQLTPVIPLSLHQLPVVLGLWAGAKCFWLKKILISIKLVNLWKHNVL